MIQVSASYQGKGTSGSKGFGMLRHVSNGACGGICCVGHAHGRFNLSKLDTNSIGPHFSIKEKGYK